ncbi:hypothetical protein [Cellulomonas hominis]
MRSTTKRGVAIGTIALGLTAALGGVVAVSAADASEERPAITLVPVPGVELPTDAPLGTATVVEGQHVLPLPTGNPTTLPG